MLNGNGLCLRRRILGSFNKALQVILLLWVNMLLNRDESLRSFLYEIVCASVVFSKERIYWKVLDTEAKRKSFFSHHSILLYFIDVCMMALLLSFTLKDGNMRHLVWNTLLLYPLIRNRWWLLLVILYKLHLHHKIPFQFSLDQQ